MLVLEPIDLDRYLSRIETISPSIAIVLFVTILTLKLLAAPELKFLPIFNFVFVPEGTLIALLRVYASEIDMAEKAL